MGAAGETTPSVAKTSIDCCGPLAPSPPRTKMRPSESSTDGALARACDSGEAEIQLPITVCGKVAFKVSASIKKPARTQMIHRYLETNFMVGPRFVNSRDSVARRCCYGNRDLSLRGNFKEGNWCLP